MPGAKGLLPTYKQAYVVLNPFTTGIVTLSKRSKYESSRNRS